MIELSAENIEHATPIIKMLSPTALKAIGTSLGWGVEKVRDTFNSTFKDHIAVTRRKCSFVRTIINPDHDTSVSDIYVNLYLDHGSESFRDESLIDQLKILSRLMIVGTGGAGKSMIMRNMVLQALSEKFEQVPLFIDLRDLEDPIKISTLDSIFLLTTPESQRANRRLFDKALESGGFCFFLDGLDEVPPESREDLRRQIDDIITRFPKTNIVISSRPDIDFAGWDDFSLFHVRELTRDQTRLIIKKTDFPNITIKEEFLQKLNSGEFEEYDSFLKVPLLNVILLMCYGEYLQLSENRSSFYDQAFEVLYRRHDRSKGLRRKHFCQIPAEDFRKLLYAFCYRSLSARAVSFSEDELSTFITKASTISNVKVDPTAFAQDLTESVSMMHRDGLKIFFIHRTFQEYFAAKFMATYRGRETFQVFDQMMRQSMSYNVQRMVAEIDFSGLEREWSKRAVAAALAKIAEAEPKGFAAKLSTIYDFIHISKGEDTLLFGGYGWNSESVVSYLKALTVVYPDHFPPEQDLMQARPITIDSSNYFESIDRNINIDLWQHILDNAGPSTPIDLRSPESTPIWLERTDLPIRLLAIEKALQNLYTEVSQRVDEESSRSVFD